MSPRVSETWAVFSTLALISLVAWLIVRNIAGGPVAPGLDGEQLAAAPTGPPPVVQIESGPESEPQPPPDRVVTDEPSRAAEPVAISVVQRLRERKGQRSYANPSETTAMNNFFWGVYPYLCILLFFVVPIIRMLTRPFSWSTRASGMFGRKMLGVASLLLHWGLFLVLIGHLAGLLGGVLGSEGAVVFFYWSGLIGGLSVLAGSAIALYRRISSPELRVISQSDDYLVHVFLITLVGIALYQVIIHRIFGVAFTAGSWAASLWTLSPQPELMGSVSLLTKIHMFVGLTFFAYFPFTKLVHFWTFPINYFVRPQLSMRTQRYRFQRRWEFAWRSDKSWLVYGLSSVAVIFLISAALLGRARPPEGSGVVSELSLVKTKTGTWLTGYPLYVSQCARCHGVSGRGDGLGAKSPTFDALPRDFVYKGDHFGARYHFVSTDNSIASDDDLYRVIAGGLENSGMPGFPDLTNDQILSLIDVLNGFRSDGPEPGRPIEVGIPPPATAASIARGAQLFVDKCVSCHGEDGSGGTQQVFNWRELSPGVPQEIKPANLKLGLKKLSIEPEDIFRRITIGIPGAFGDANLMLKFDDLSVEDRWAIVHFVTEEILP